MYPYKFTNVHQFVQRVADNIVKHGYVNYVTGTIPEGKDCVDIDAKILSKDGIAVSRWTRARRKQKGQANIHYVRHQNFFAMFAPKGGAHKWFQDEEWATEQEVKSKGARIRNLARPGQALVYGGYTIAFKQCSATKRGHVAVRIHPDEYRALKAYYLDLAVRRSKEKLEDEFRYFPFEPWAGIRQQRWNILRAVNAKRKKAGFEPIDAGVLRKKRIQYKLMAPECSAMVQGELALERKKQLEEGSVAQLLDTEAA